jgi:hypothetical protein
MGVESRHDEQDEYAQGVWRSVEATPRKIAGRKDGRAPHEFLDVAAFGRLVKKYGRPDGTIDGRPKDAREAEEES